MIAQVCVAAVLPASALRRVSECSDSAPASAVGSAGYDRIVSGLKLKPYIFIIIAEMSHQFLRHTMYPRNKV